LNAFLTSRDGFYFISSFEHLLYFIVVTYSLGHIVSYLSSITIEKYSLYQFNYPSKFLLNQRPFSPRKNPASWLVRIIVLPIWVLEVFLGRLLKLRKYYAGPLDDMV